MASDVISLTWAQIWQTSLLILVVALVTRTLFRRSPILCSLIWVVALLKSLVPPIWSSPVGVFSWSQVQVSGVEHLGQRSILTMVDTWLRTNVPTNLVWLLVGVWLVGVFLRAAVTLVRWRLVYRALRPLTPEEDHLVRPIVDRIANQMGLRSVGVCVNDDLLGPAVIGILRYQLILPSVMLEAKETETIEPIVAHELVHLRRGDTFVSLLQTVIQVVWWFHPLVSWASREVSLHNERCADNEVLKLGFEPRHYANCLLTVLETKCRFPANAAAVGMNAMEITERRLKNIMRGHSREYGTGVTRLMLAGVLCIAILPGASLQIQPQHFVPTHEFNPDLPPDYKCWSAEMMDADVSEAAVSTATP